MPALPIGTDAPIKKISPLILPNFRGLSTEDTDQFLFEFKILCKTYDYELDNQKMKHFPSTLKDNAMRWFMDLFPNCITSWEKWNRFFLKNIKSTAELRT